VYSRCTTKHIIEENKSTIYRGIKQLSKQLLAAKKSAQKALFKISIKKRVNARLISTDT